MSPANFLASAALSPAGTTKTSTPLRRAPIVFCSRPPTGTTSPSSSSSPVTAIRASAVDVAAELVEDVEREREPRRRAADVAGLDADVDGQLDLGALLDADADDGAVALGRDRATVSSASSLSSSPRRTPRLHLVAGRFVRMSPDQILDRAHPLAVDRDDHVRRLQRARGGGRRVDGGDEDAGRHGLDVVAELAQRDGRGDLLRAAHLAQVAAAPVRLAQARRVERVAGDERRAFVDVRPDALRAESPCGRRRSRSRCRRRPGRAARPPR